MGQALPSSAPGPFPHKPFPSLFVCESINSRVPDPQPLAAPILPRALHQGAPEQPSLRPKPLPCVPALCWACVQAPPCCPTGLSEPGAWGQRGVADSAGVLLSPPCTSPGTQAEPRWTVIRLLREQNIYAGSAPAGRGAAQPAPHQRLGRFSPAGHCGPLSRH